MSPSSRSLTDEIKSLIIETIDSYGHLQVLILLASNPARKWSALAVGQELRTNEEAAQIQLRDLQGHGLLDREADLFFFHPKHRKWEKTVGDLIAIHSSYQSRIIGLIYDKPNERLRNFADAFKLRKDPKEEPDGNGGKTMAEWVYVLCSLVSLVCAVMLFRSHARVKSHLLFWSAVCFTGFALNNLILFVDVALLPDVDLAVVRIVPAFLGVVSLVYGLVKNSA